MSKVTELADRFWSEFQQKELTPERFYQREYRALMAKFGYMIRKPNAAKPGLGMDGDKIIQGLRMMKERGVSFDSPNAVYMFENREYGKTWFDIALEPMVVAPPIYEQNNLRWFKQEYMVDPI